jgi:hypothetical protein
MFIDESNFMAGHAVRTLVRRPIGTAFEKKIHCSKSTIGRCFVPVLGILCSGSIGPLVRIEDHFDAEKDIEILDENVILNLYLF